MVDVHEPIDDEQAEMHTWPPADFCGSDLEETIHIHPIFESCPLMQMSNDGGVATVHHSYQFSSTLRWIIVD